ncbi:uncharacterized protein LOC132849008 isoform X1 [Tachysurus vachellii]|uniref:uncharacterized protein LOC132849008 isoform X1 n=1 Tax=Tachysurus vachellii TaxID=175792 RepID=UPI00296B0E7C|nr:uncharacterized protein LOC132849008 isoform X1 [Tachysurus vachellii]
MKNLRNLMEEAGWRQMNLCYMLKFLLNGCRIERRCGSLGIRTSRHETDSEAYKADMAYSEKVTISKRLRRPSNELNKRLSPSTARNSRRSSSSPQTRSKRGSSSAFGSPNRRKTSTPQSSKGTSSSVPGSSQRRTSSAPHDVLRDTSAGPRRVGNRDGQTITSAKRTGEKEPSTSSRQRRRQRTHPTPEHDNLPAPQWVIDLMLDIEEATKHKLTVE